MTKVVLISWIAVNNDPYERVRASRGYRLVDGKPVPGPTLTLLFDKDSPYCGRIDNAVLLFRQQPGPDGDAERNVVRETVEAIRAIEPKIKVSFRQRCVRRSAAIRIVCYRTL
jgi:hypothetical protein